MIINEPFPYLHNHSDQPTPPCLMILTCFSFWLICCFLSLIGPLITYLDLILRDDHCYWWYEEHWGSDPDSGGSLMVKDKQSHWDFFLYYDTLLWLSQNTLAGERYWDCGYTYLISNYYTGFWVLNQLIGKPCTISFYLSSFFNQRILK